MTTAQLIRAALFGGRRMTVAELVTETGLRENVIKGHLRADPGLVRVGTRPSIGRPATLWGLAGEVEEVVTVERSRSLMLDALAGGKQLTTAALAGICGVQRFTVERWVKDADDVVCVGFTVPGKGRGGNRPKRLFALAGVAPAVRREALGPPGPGRGEIRDTEGTESESHDYGGGISSIVFVASPAETDCPTLGRVVLAACIDGYVTDSARQRGPCDSCAIGRARRAAYAGADFEDELEADDSDSLDLR